MTLALTRGIPSTFPDATTEVVGGPPIDVDRGRAQHAAYVRGLEALGLRVLRLEADDRFPDGCFVEDCALVAEGVALITRPGAPSRRGEVDAIAATLRGRGDVLERVEEMAAPATLDGGDCLRVGRRIFVGRSARTNEAGVARVREVFGPRGFEVTSVPLSGVLHLKCVCSPLGDGRVLLAEGTIPPTIFEGIELVTIPNAEAYAANCVARGGTALISAGFPETQAILERAGVRTIALETTEIRKADGALTCLSILLG